MERIFSSAPLFFGASKEAPTTAGLRLAMREPIDGKILRHAVDEAIIRYPYFSVKAELEEGWYVLRENKALIPVIESAEPVPLGGEAVDYHLIIFRYYGKILNCEMFHGIADSVGLRRILNTVLHYYCSMKYGQLPKTEKLLLKEDPIPKEEFADPYHNPIEEDITPIGRYVNKGAARLFDENAEGSWVAEIRIPENAFVRFSRQNDGSPAVMSALLMSRAIREVLGKTELPVVCGMAMDIRPVLKTPDAHHSLISQLFLEYGEKVEKMDLMSQATAFRGMVILQSQPENVLTSVRNNMGFVKKLEELSDFASRKKFMGDVMTRAMSGATFKVSYAGNHSMEAADKYIEKIAPFIDIKGAGIMLEISAFDGNFYISFLQESGDDRYLNAFLKQLRQAEISYDVGDLKPYTMPGIDFPGAGGCL